MIDEIVVRERDNNKEATINEETCMKASVRVKRTNTEGERVLYPAPS
jgi:hypothetical protein